MNTFVLSPETAGTPVKELLSQVANGNIAVLDGEGKLIAYVLSPAGREELIYAEAQRDLDLHRDEIREAAERRIGVTTKELLENARAAAEQSDRP